jgi:hypothetical protein
MLFIEHLGISMNAFERECGLGKRYVANIRKSIQPDTLEKIALTYPQLNKGWLMTGEGTMLKETNTSDGSSPCFDVATIQGGAAHGTGSEQIMPGMEVGRMLVPGLKTGNDIPYIQVKGDSMVNRKNPTRSIPEGAWVGVRASTLSTIMWGEVYAIMTTDGPIIKKVVQSDKEECIRCVSYNEEDGFAPFDLPYTDIIPPLYNVLAVVNIKLWK